MLSCEGKVISCKQNVEFYKIYPESEYLVIAYFF